MKPVEKFQRNEKQHASVKRMENDVNWAENLPEFLKLCMNRVLGVGHNEFLSLSINLSGLTSELAEFLFQLFVFFF